MLIKAVLYIKKKRKGNDKKMTKSKIQLLLSTNMFQENVLPFPGISHIPLHVYGKVNDTITVWQIHFSHYTHRYASRSVPSRTLNLNCGNINVHVLSLKQL